MTLAKGFDLHDRVALVTGASSGIGAHAAATFAAAGATVVLAARRQDRLAAQVDQLRAAGHEAHAVALDVADPASIEAAWRAAEAAVQKPIDILFNNAGVIYVERFVQQTLEQIDRILDTNLRGAMLMAQQAARSMAERRSGSIINVASTAGLRAGGSLASYGASKAGLIHLTRIMALELAARGVRVNALAPGNLRTDMHDSFREHGFDEGLEKRIPMRRFGEVGDLDGATLLLASDAGRYITGVVLPVDGGQTLAWM